MLSKVYGPRAYNIVGDDDSKKRYTHEHSENDEIYITIPGQMSVRTENK